MSQKPVSLAASGSGLGLQIWGLILEKCSHLWGSRGVLMLRFKWSDYADHYSICNTRTVKSDSDRARYFMVYTTPEPFFSVRCMKVRHGRVSIPYKSTTPKKPLIGLQYLCGKRRRMAAFVSNCFRTVSEYGFLNTKLGNCFPSWDLLFHSPLTSYYIRG